MSRPRGRRGKLAAARAASGLAMVSIGQVSVAAPLTQDEIFPPALPAASLMPMPVSLRVNGSLMDEPALVLRIGNSLLLRREDWVRLGLRPMATMSFDVAGRPFVALAIKGMRAWLSADRDELSIEAEPALFSRQILSVAPRTAGPPTGSIIPALFLGYDLSLRGDGRSSTISGLLDSGVSGAWGVAGTRLLVGGRRRLVRLDTSFQRDFPDRRLRLVLGDTWTSAGAFGPGMRFAGFRVSSGAPLRPGEIDYPLPVVSGTARTASTVELLAGGSPQSLSVGPGAFQIQTGPSVTGAGMVTMTISDLEGRARVVRRPLYVSSQLLEPGRSYWNLEGGLTRRSYGLRSFGYGAPFAAFDLRRGLSRRMTAQLRVEAGTTVRDAAVTMTAVVGSLGEVEVSGAASASAVGIGSFWRIQARRLAGPASLTASWQQRSANFAVVGDPLTRRSARREAAISGGLGLPHGLGISATVLDSRSPDDASYRLAVLSISGHWHSWQGELGGRSTFGRHGQSGAVFLAIHRSFGPRSGLSLAAADRELVATLQHRAHDDQGAGYGLMAGSRGGRIVAGAYATARTGVGEFEIGASNELGRWSWQAEASGAFIAMAGRVAATPRITDAFAAVVIDSAQPVRVFQEERPVAQRGRSGHPVFLTNLLPYVANRVSLDPSALPISATIDTAQQFVVPGFRQATVLRLGQWHTHPLSLRLVDESGAALRPGSTVSVEGQTSAPIGYDGLEFLSDARPGQRLRVSSGKSVCMARLPNALPDTGEIDRPILCVAEQRSRS